MLLTTNKAGEASRHADATDVQLQLLVDSVRDYAIFMMNTEGCVTSWNAGAEAIKGYSAAEILGQPYSVFFSADSVAKGHPTSLLRQAAECVAPV